MLKRFTVENFSSYDAEVSLDMTAGRSGTHLDHVVSFSKTKILRGAVIYGANAAGKSNLVKAIDYAKNIITRGLSDVDTYKKYFRLNSDSSKKTSPSQFEFEFELNNKFFSYGFSSILSENKINEEWLFEIGRGKPSKIFERIDNEVHLGSYLKKKQIEKRFEVYIDDMKNQSDQLFLTEIAGKDLEIEEISILNNIYHWFAKKIIIIYPNTQYIPMALARTDEKLSKELKKYLNEFDTGIVDIFPVDDDFEQRFDKMPLLKKDIEKELLKKEVDEITLNIEDQQLSIFKDEKNELKVKKLGLIHIHNQDSREVFELKDESDGTKRLIDLIPLIKYFGQDYTIIIDEFDRSLHPKLARQIFRYFYSEHDSTSQLIATTHESNLLDLDLVRRDEIWFAEKNDKGATSLFSLNQFKVRYDSKIEKAYLLGRYGAIPIFKDFNEVA